MKFLNYFLIFCFLSFSFGCQNEKQSEVKSVNVYSMVDPSAKFDLQALGALIKSGQIKNAADLEKEVNKEGGINNLDLNSDDKTDYVNVKENPSSANLKSFDLFTKAKEGINHLATIEVEMNSDNYRVAVAGNPQIYGQNATYEDHFDVGDAAIGAFAAWAIMSSREPYQHQPYYYGNYPSYYQPYRTVSTSVYRSRTEPMTKSTSFKKTSTPLKSKSTYSGQTTKSVKSKYSNSRKNMKQLKKRKENKAVKKGGFTKSKKSKFKKTRPQNKRKYKRKKRRIRSSRSRGSRRRH